jgi:hypothetical protein
LLHGICLNAMSKNNSPNNLDKLHAQEQSLRQKAIEIIQSQPKLSLHLDAIEGVMTLTRLLVDYPNNEEDFKVIKMLSVRMFNAFGASLALMTTGYHQKAGLVMRDTLETLFLLDLFRTDYTAIERWRFADKGAERKEFSPVAVRNFLDKRDGLSSRKREETYKMFCKLAAHPNMHSQHMLRPIKGGDILMGPFVETTTLEAGLYELGKLAIQVGEIINFFFPSEWDRNFVRTIFAQIKRDWLNTFPRQITT